MPVLKRKKWTWPLLWIPLALVLSFAIYFSLKWGLKPKPIPQINPTRFESLEQIGAVVYRRLRPALRQEKLVVLGSSEWITGYERVWNGFIAAARQDKWKIDVVFNHPSLQSVKEFTGLESQKIAWPDESGPLGEDIKKRLQFGHLILVHTSYKHSAHRGESSLTKDLEKALKRPWTAITMLGFASSEEELSELQPTCKDEVNPADRTEYAACAAVRISRRFFRKRLDPSFIWAAMDRHGLKDYFVYIHLPKN